MTNLKFTINKTLNDFNDLIFKRDRLLDFNSVFLFICKYNSSDSNSYNSSISSLIIDNLIPNVSKTAFILKLKFIDCTYFIQLNNIIINFFYDIINKNKNNNNNNNNDENKRLLAIDGSITHFKKSLNTEFKLSNNKNYTTGKISCLFDVNFKIPINYLLSKSLNERNLLIEQLSYVKSNDILIADRGYFSYDVINKIIENNSNFIFRIKKNNNFVANIKNNESFAIFNYNHKGKIYKFKIYKYNAFDKFTLSNIEIEKIKKSIQKNKKSINKIEKQIIKCSSDYHILISNKNNIINIEKDIENKKKKLKTNNILIKENINNKKKFLEDLNDLKKKNSEHHEKLKKNNSENDSYYLLTSCYKMTNNELKQIYLKRWGIETNFRFLKSNFKFDKLNSLNINTIKKNLYTCQFIFIIESLINYITPNELFKNDNMISIMNQKNIKTTNQKNIKTTNQKNIKTTNQKNIKTTNQKNIKIINQKKNKNTNKTLSINLIGNHLLKHLFITKLKKKEKIEIYKKNEKQKIITLTILSKIIIIINEIIKNKIDNDIIKENNIKNKETKMRINRRPRRKIWI